MVVSSGVCRGQSRERHRGETRGLSAPILADGGCRSNQDRATPRNGHASTRAEPSGQFLVPGGICAAPLAGLRLAALGDTVCRRRGRGLAPEERLSAHRLGQLPRADFNLCRRPKTAGRPVVTGARASEACAWRWAVVSWTRCMLSTVAQGGAGAAFAVPRVAERARVRGGVGRGKRRLLLHLLQAGPRLCFRAGPRSAQRRQTRQRRDAHCNSRRCQAHPRQRGCGRVWRLRCRSRESARKLHPLRSTADSAAPQRVHMQQAVLPRAAAATPLQPSLEPRTESQ